VVTKPYVLIEAAVGKTKDVFNAVQGIHGVRDVDAVIVEYDIASVFEADNAEQRCGFGYWQHPLHRRDTCYGDISLSECGVKAMALATHG
jgi:hypothetical protein